MGFRRFVWVIAGVVCGMLAVATCTPAGSPVPTSQLEVAPTATPPAASTVLTTVDPDTISAQLTPAATVDQVAEQFATAMGTTKDAIRVRMYAPMNTDSCYDCNKLPAEFAKWEHEGVPLSDVPLPLAPGSAVWLTARGVECRFSYNGTDLVPRYCQAAPSPTEQDQP